MPIDMSAAKPPPRKRTGGTVAKAASAATPADTRTPHEKRSQGLKDLSQLGIGACLMFSQYADAANIGKNFPPVADELAKLADHYEIIAKPIDFLCETGPFFGLIVALTPFTLQFLANHKVISADGLAGQGVVPPSVLEAQMKAEVLLLQAQAMKAQQQAVEEAQKAQREYEAMLASEAERVTV